MKPWDGFCGPLEVRTHPLPPPDSGASFSSFGVFLFEIWLLRFRSRVLRFRDLGVFVFDLGCFVFEFWVLRFRDLGASCFGLRFRVLRFRNYHPREPLSGVLLNTASHQGHFRLSRMRSWMARLETSRFFILTMGPRICLVSSLLVTLQYPEKD